jgi:hypothetical protein
MSWLDSYFSNVNEIAGVAVSGGRTVNYSTGLDVTDDGKTLTVTVESRIGTLPVDTSGVTRTGSVIMSFDIGTGILSFFNMPS